MNQKNIISKLTLEEKIAMIHAAGLFRSGAVKRLNIPSLVMSDGPSGVRQEFENDSWTPIDDTTDFVSWLPSNTCLCTTWNPNLAHKFGEVLGNEARGRGKDVSEFGDYFRTQRWNQAPGCDQPNLGKDI